MSLKINGSTSGSVTLDAPATGSNISFTLPGSVGTNGQLLSTNGSGVLSFVNGGKILQIVRATDATNRTTTSTTFVDASLSITITPQKSDSAVLLIWSLFPTPDSTEYLVARITDNSNNAISGAESVFMGSASGGVTRMGGVLIGYATPATTSAVTYKARFRTNDAGSVSIENATTTGQLYAIEVSA